MKIAVKEFIRSKLNLRALVVVAFAAATSFAADKTEEKKPAAPSDLAAAKQAEKAAADYPKELFAGKVVLLRDALKQRDIKSYEEETKDQVVLETGKGDLIPIVPDWRGRAFYQDKRLRDRKVELVGFRKPGVPYLQVLSIFTFNDQGERQYTDYWCDICAIPMYEIKKCDCCQGPIRLRFQNKGLPDYLKIKPGPAAAPAKAAEGVKSK